jgi:hypothetical protein
VLNPVAAVAHMSSLAGVFSSSDHLQTVTALAAAYSACQDSGSAKPELAYSITNNMIRVAAAITFFCIEFNFPNYRN